MTKPRGVLLTAFEPSGDALAAPVIDKLLTQRPDLTVWALGGPQMRAAGATLLEMTTERATMLLGSLSQLQSHRRRLQRLADWLTDHALQALVPVDSPAANWSICKLIRQRQPRTSIVHLVAPQLWAWAPWRIGKLRRLTDHVLCLLPFEPDWFTSRGVPATFVGHPLFDAPAPDTQGVTPLAFDATANDRPKIALLPGSRPGEIRRNGPTMIQAFMMLQSKHPQLRGVIATANPTASQWVRRAAEPWVGQDQWPDNLKIQSDQTDAVLAWADIALVVSGTATLHAAARQTPMVVLYNISRWSWHLWGRWLVQTRTFSLPNLIAQADGQPCVVPELVPHFGQPQPVADELERLIRSHGEQDRQRETFGRIIEQFAAPRFGQACVQQLLKQL